MFTGDPNTEENFASVIASSFLDVHGQPGVHIAGTPAQQTGARQLQPGRHRIGIAADVLADGLGTAVQDGREFVEGEKLEVLHRCFRVGK